MAIDIANGWSRYDFSSPTTSYYGYSYAPNPSDNDSVYSIRQIVTSASVSTVRWAYADMSNLYSIWNNRTSYFKQPSGSIGLTFSSSQGYSNYNISISWNLLNGVDRYVLTIKDPSGSLIDKNGNKLQSQYVIRNYSDEFYNVNSCIANVTNTGTYNITLMATNSIGSTSSTINLTI